MEFSHLKDGTYNMVDVTLKEDSERIAIAEGFIKVGSGLVKKIKESKVEKGDVLAIAQIAGIQGAKKTSDLIPLCHNIFITKVDLETEVLEEDIRVKCTTKTISKTGVEMEALTGVSVALLTIYDMLKSVKKDLEIYGIKLLYKSGGKSGVYEKK